VKELWKKRRREREEDVERQVKKKSDFRVSKGVAGGFVRSFHETPSQSHCGPPKPSKL